MVDPAQNVGDAAELESIFNDDTFELVDCLRLKFIASAADVRTHASKELIAKHASDVGWIQKKRFMGVIRNNIGESLMDAWIGEKLGCEPTANGNMRQFMATEMNVTSPTPNSNWYLLQ